ncbi:MAG: glucosidase [Bacteroidota bacterium]
MPPRIQSNPESNRLTEHYAREKNWMKWGSYLSERQWGTVREDYSAKGEVWTYFKHDHARSRAYRWGEDGIAGICDRYCRICFGVAMWNGKDSIIKERLFGLTGKEGNHGEDVKELYYYLDNTPTHSYMKHLYKYPQAAFPYEDLLKTNAELGYEDEEYEILNTGAFDDNRYFDVFTEYAKANEEDILIKITVHNRSKDKADLTLLPTLWLRNLWSFGLMEEKPNIQLKEKKVNFDRAEVTHSETGTYHLYFEAPRRYLFTDNESNKERLFGTKNASLFVKDSINDAVVNQDYELVQQRSEGTKFSPMYMLELEGEQSTEIRLRLSNTGSLSDPLGEDFDQVFAQRIEEANQFYDNFILSKADEDLRNIQRQAYAGMLWTKQYYHYDVNRWLEGDPATLAPPTERKRGRNHKWTNLVNEDIISMPDKWEYPWYAAWDLAFHCVPLAHLDVNFAKKQLLLFLKEWYLSPKGQLPAYEWKFEDVNPPVHAWACLQVYRIEQKVAGVSDVDFLKMAFHKLLINFTWWVNQKDHNDNNIFEGGFLGMDNIGVFDRSMDIPNGGALEQADGTSWMAMYCLNMLDMALEIAQTDPTYEDVATKFLEHFVYIAQSLNSISKGFSGAWDEEEGFFYDILVLNDEYIPLKIRSLVGLTTLFASLLLEKERLAKVPKFTRRLKWFRDYRKDYVNFLVIEELEEGEDLLLSLIPKDRLGRLLQALLDEQEFFSDGGIRSLSKIHEKQPYYINIKGQQFGLKYDPGVSRSGLFGGNSNWRGPIWFPMNYLIIQSLREYDSYYGDRMKVESPTGSGRYVCLSEVADDISARLISLFTQNEDAKRPVYGNATIYKDNPHFKELVLFYEYFNGDTGEGLGAAHQTGWTGLVAELIYDIYG